MPQKRAIFLTTHTPNNEVFWKSLECAGWDVTPHRYDDRPHARHVELIDYARSLSPDAIAYVGALETHGISNPIPDCSVLRALRDVAPTVLLCGDACDNAWWPQMAEYRARECFDVFVSIDGSEHEGMVAKLTPVDARPYETFKREWGERDVFVGSNKGPGEGGERGDIINHLGAVTQGGVMSSDDMAAFLCRCKVVPNGPRSGASNDHVKGRVVEAGMAGACLLERRNAATARWFKPGIDYIEYENAPDAAAKVEWIRAHDDEARKIAESFHQMVWTQHHPSVFWADIMERAGVKA